MEALIPPRFYPTLRLLPSFSTTPDLWLRRLVTRAFFGSTSSIPSLSPRSVTHVARALIALEIRLCRDETRFPVCSLQCFLVLWADFCLTLCPFAWLVCFKTYPALFQLSFRLMRQWLNRQYNLMPVEIPGTNRHFASNERISRRWRTEDRQQLPPRLSPWKQDHLQVFQRLMMRFAAVTWTTCHSLKSSRLLWKWSIFDGGIYVIKEKDRAITNFCYPYHIPNKLLSSA